MKSSISRHMNKNTRKINATDRVNAKEVCDVVETLFKSYRLICGLKQFLKKTFRFLPI